MCPRCDRREAPMACRTGRFGASERLWMQLSFHGVWILGAVSMLRASALLAIGYVVLFPGFGVLFLVMRRWVCPGCPHLVEHGSCVQAPASIARRIVGKGPARPLNLAERLGFFVVLYGVALVPAYWVVQARTLLVPYLVLTSMHYLAYHLHFCRRCLNLRCPQNTTAGAGCRSSSG